MVIANIGSKLPDRYVAHVDVLTRDFVGRQWLFNAFDEWIKDKGSTRYLMLEGPPGIGKSSFIARLARQQPFAALHFCLARQQDTVDPLSFTESLFQQLAAKFPSMLDAAGNTVTTRVDVRVNVQRNEGTAIGASIGALAISAPSASAAFSRLIVGPLLRLGDEQIPQSTLILVDGLDEAIQSNGPESIVDLIARAEGLPRSVRFILTSRPSEIVRGQFAPSAIQTIKLDAGSPQNVTDIEQYVQNVLGADKELMAALRSRHPLREPAFTQKVARASGYNFLCAHWLLRALRNDPSRFDGIDELPRGLADVYYEFLQARGFLKAIKPWREKYRPVIGILAAARSGLPANEIALACDMPLQDVSDVLTDLDQFLDPAERQREHYQLYHASLVDFFEKKDAAREFWIDLSAIHRSIATTYTKEFTGRWHEAGNYALDFLPYHLFSANAQHELERLLCDFEFLQAVAIKRGVGTVLLHHGYVSDARIAQNIRTSVRTQRHRLETRPDLFLQQVSNWLFDLNPQIPDFVQESMERAARALQVNTLAWFKRVNYAKERSDEAFDMVISESARFLALSGSSVAIADASGEIALHDTRSGLIAQRFTNPDPIHALAVSQDGAIMARFGHSGACEIYDIANEILLARHHIAGEVRCAAFSNRNDCIAIGTKDGLIASLNTADGTLNSIATLKAPIARIRVSSDGTRIAAITEKQGEMSTWAQLVVIDAHSGTVCLEQFDDSIDDVAFGQDIGEIIATMSELDINYVTLVRIFGADGSKRREYYDYMWRTAVANLSDGRRLATGGAYGSIVLWRPVEGDPWELDDCPSRVELLGHDAGIEDLLAASDGDLLVSRDKAGTVKAWHTRRAARKSVGEHRFPVVDGSISPDGQSATSIDYRGGRMAWRVDGGDAITLPETVPSEVHKCAFTSLGNIVAIGLSGDVAYHIDMTTRKTTSHKLRLGEYANVMAISPDGDHAIVVNSRSRVEKNAVSLVALTSTSKTIALEPISAVEERALFTASGSYFIINVGGHVVCYERATATKRWTIDVGRYEGTFAVSRDEKLFALASKESIVLYDFSSPRSALSTIDCKSVTVALAFMAGNTLLVAADDNRVVTVWDIQQRQAIATFLCEAQIRSIWCDAERLEVVLMDGARLPRIMRFQLARCV